MVGFPPFFPKPPFLFQSDDEGEEEPDEKEVIIAFRKKMRSEGFDPDLVEMGVKMANNHMRPPEEAFKIGENYIREMAK